jgi:hypothetical protein
VSVEPQEFLALQSDIDAVQLLPPAIRRQEYVRWSAEVTPADLLWYLRDV